MIVSKPPSACDRLIAGEAVVAQLFSAVSFRETEEAHIFRHIERRLMRRDAARFAGYAEARRRANDTGTDIQARVAALTSDPRWHGMGNLLYNVELEVWMDLSRPIEGAMALYEACLENAVPFYVRHSGPFTPLFGRLLLQKNGFERVSEGPIPEGSVVLEDVVGVTA